VISSVTLQCVQRYVGYFHCEIRCVISSVTLQCVQRYVGYFHCEVRCVISSITLDNVDIGNVDIDNVDIDTMLSLLGGRLLHRVRELGMQKRGFPGELGLGSDGKTRRECSSWGRKVRRW
jgi:hypothetical protein